MTRYTSGRAKEWDARKRMKAKGCYVIRSAGSKGLIDLVSLCSDHVVLAQVKYTKSGSWIDDNWRELERRKQAGEFPYARIVAIVYHRGTSEPNWLWGTGWAMFAS